MGGDEDGDRVSIVSNPRAGDDDDGRMRVDDTDRWDQDHQSLQALILHP